MFSQACVISQGGGHAWLLGCVWLLGGMRGCWGACIVARGCMVAWRGVHGCQGCMIAAGVCVVVGGHAWLLGGVHGEGGMDGEGGVHGKRGAW